MTKTVVVYKSKYGSTKKYAEWIAEKLNADIFENSKVNLAKLMEYDTLIFGGGVIAGAISGIKLLTKNIKHLKQKNLIVFSVGLTIPDDTKALDNIYNRNFKPEIKNSITFFHYQGCMKLENLSFLHRKVMNTVIKSTDKKSDKTKADIDFVTVCRNGEDFCKKENVCNLVSYVKSI